MYIYNQIKNYLWLALLLCAAGPVVYTSVSDMDGWWHIQLGRDLLLGSVDYSKYYWSEVTNNIGDLRYTFLGDIILYLVNFLGGDIGLVLLRACVVGVCCFFLWETSDKKLNWFKLFFFILLVVGTYQKQIVRNSLCGMAFLPVLFYLFQWKKYLSIILLLTVWNFTHGSYLLGFGMLGVLSLSDLKKENILIYGVILFVCFGILSIKNPMTTSYFSLHFAGSVVGSTSLNGTVFNGSQGGSIDFMNPFDLDRVYIRVSMFVAILTPFLIKSFRLAYILPYLAITALGFGYVRTVGYMPIVCTWILFQAEKNGDLRTVRESLYLALSVMITVSIYLYKDKILFSLSEFGLKRNYIYTDRVAKIALAKYKNQKTFTTTTNGGYLLTKWYPHKKVYIDTHFPPHPQKVFDKYKYYLNNPYDLKFQCSTAIIPINKIGILNNFIRSGWCVESVDSGQVLFTRTKQTPQILFSSNEYNNFSAKHKRILGQALKVCRINLKL